MEKIFLRLTEQELVLLIRREIALAKEREIALAKERENGIATDTQKATEEPIQERYYTANETAAILRVTRMTLWRYRRRGLLQPCYIGSNRLLLYSRKDVDSIGLRASQLGDEIRSKYGEDTE